jgi:hypothetical protein
MKELEKEFDFMLEDDEGYYMEDDLGFSLEGIYYVEKTFKIKGAFLSSFQNEAGVKHPFLREN